MKLIVANWKSNPEALKKAKRLALAEDYKGVVIVPPFPYLDAVGSVLQNAALGAQDVFWENGGPYTGEVSPSQLKDIGVKYVIVGHSERREHLKETDGMINKKVKAALSAGLEIILCVGEHLETRKQGIKSAKDYITTQLKNDLRGIRRGDAKRITIAYEPIWAVGTGTPDIPEEAAEISAYIKNLVSVARVIYGGSVDGKNAEEFLNQDDIDGALPGGSSLKPKEFSQIVKAAQ